jgi:hypothetical protein
VDLLLLLLLLMTVLPLLLLLVYLLLRLLLGLIGLLSLLPAVGGNAALPATLRLPAAAHGTGAGSTRKTSGTWYQAYES